MLKYCFSRWLISVLSCLLLLSGCGGQDDPPSRQETVPEAQTALPEPEKDAPSPEDPTPTEEEVLAARQLATEGMSEDEISRLKEVIRSANMWWESKYLYKDIFRQLSSPDSLAWNYFEQTGEIQIGWAYSGDIDKEAVYEREGLSTKEFYAKYGTRVVTENDYDADDFIAILSDLEASVQNETMKEELQDLIVQVDRAKETHRVEVANYMYKKLHDLDYFLLRYGPKDFGSSVLDKSTISKYYDTLFFYH